MSDVAVEKRGWKIGGCLVRKRNDLGVRDDVCVQRVCVRADGMVSLRPPSCSVENRIASITEQL